MMIDRDYVQTILSRMVQIDSRNPDLVPEGVGEAALGAYVADLMRDLGLEVHVHELAAGRVNVVGILRGTANGRSLLLNAHMDTVGVEGLAEPFSGAVREGKLYGRGSQDMKGSLAAMIAAAKGLVDAGTELAGDLILTAVADEEYISIGTEDLVKHYTADAAIVTEPTDMVVCRAHRGFVWYEVETVGRAAHGSRYDEGIDANMRMGRFLAELDKLERELREKRPLHPLTGSPSLHAAMIRGGTALSVYADRCVLNVERRLNPGETEAQATAELRAIIDRLAAADPTFQTTVKPLFSRTPFFVEAEATIVGIVADLLETEQPHMGASFWTDAAILADAGIETMVLGPVGAGLHSAEEWAEVASVVELAGVLAQTAVRYCI